MKPSDLPLLSAAGRPAITADGDVFVAIATPDLEHDRYSSRIHRIAAGTDGPVAFTAGPRDSAPVLSPDGETLVFCRAGETGPAQLFAMPRRGGEPRKLTDHKLGASAPVFSADGKRLAYLASVPQAGRYGTDKKISAEAEAPRRITRMSYRFDGKGFTSDKPEQIFVVDLAEGSVPRQVTDEPGGAGQPAFTPDGTRLVYVRETAVDVLTNEIAVVDAAAERAVGQILAPTAGDAVVPVVAGETVYFSGQAFTGVDFCGRAPGLWSVALDGGRPRRLTDENTVHVDGSVGEPVVVGDQVLVAVQNRGAVELRAVPVNGDLVPLDQLGTVIGGRRVVKSFTVSGSNVAAVVGDPRTLGEVVTLSLGEGAAPQGESIRTDLAADLRTAGIAEVVELTTTSADGYPVHGWLVLPAGEGPHPVLLDVHGGPHASYGWALFDEAQMYAGAGYAVVLPNPRGSSGYGQAHGRAVVRGIGTVDVDDVLAMLDAALERPDLDAARVGVMGGSYGGFMTSWLASQHPERFTAGISERALNAWDSFAGSSDIGYFFAEAYVGADRESQWKASPLAYADDIAIPLLIIHSEHDWRCPVEQAQRLFTSLKRRGAETELVLFPSEGHELSRSGRPRHREQRFALILDWWNKHLPVA